jgi:CHAD domain-containing protein
MAAPRPVRGLRASTHLREAAPAFLAARLADVLQHCRALAQRLTPEHVHNVRVALRRLRAAVGLYGKSDGSRRADAELRRFQTALGTLRDAQVQLAGLSQLRRRLPAEEAAVVRVVRERLEVARQKSAEATRAGLRRWQKRGPRALEALHHLHPKGRLGGHRIRKRLVRQLEHLEGWASAALADAGPAPMHQLRIAVRRFRYALEFLEPAMPGETAAIRSDFIPLQTALGDLHDLDVQMGLVDAHTPQRQRPSAAALKSRLRAEREQLAGALRVSLTHWEEEASALRAQVLLVSSPVHAHRRSRR